MKQKTRITLPEFLARLQKLKAKGYVPSLRSGPTGIGKTSEEYLGIPENNIAGADTTDFEIKSERKDATSMVTLFTKSPLPPKVNAVLLETFGYPSRKHEHGLELHTTVKASTYNSLCGKVGFKLGVSDDAVSLLDAKRNVVGYWDKATLKKSFEKKYPRLVYVLADARITNGKEEFWFDEAWLLEGFSFAHFISLIKEDVILVDIRIGQYPNGKPHDHGTGFRVFPKYFDTCFQSRKRLL